MSSAPPIEPASAEDIAELVAIRAQQSWHTNRWLLAASIGWEGCRFFVMRPREESAPDQARIIAAAFALAAGPVGTIGNVVVRPEYQRSGLGRGIMEAALAWQREQGVCSVLLDATVAGRPLYHRLGFVEAGARSWFAHTLASHLQRERLLAQAGALQATLRTSAAIWQMADLDQMAFGGNRIGLLARTLEVAPAWLYVAEDESGAPLGYVMARLDEGDHPLLRVGPWVARSPAGAAALLAAMLAPNAPWRASVAVRGEPVLTASMPGYNPDALMLWQGAGGMVEVDDVIMQLDFTGTTGITPAKGPLRQFTQHPEWAYAWLSSMTF